MRRPSLLPLLFLVDTRHMRLSLALVLASQVLGHVALVTAAKFPSSVFSMPTSYWWKGLVLRPLVRRVHVPLCVAGKEVAFNLVAISDLCWFVRL